MRSFAVLWRDPETGRQTFLTYDDEREARVAKELIEAAGGYAVEAARIAEAVRKSGPTVLEAISEHNELLNGVGADTRSHYRQQLATHIAPVIGSYPVSALTYRHVAGWVRAMTTKGLAPKTVANVHGLLTPRARADANGTRREPRRCLHPPGTRAGDPQSSWRGAPSRSRHLLRGAP